MKKTITYLTFILAAGFGTSCSSHSQADAQAEAISVEVCNPSRSGASAVSVSGSLVARNHAEISTRMMAFVKEIYVKPGDRVKAGQLLIRLNADELLAKRKQALAQLEEVKLASALAEKDFKRFQQLHAQHSVSDKELENMELNKTSMAAKLEMARQGLKEIDAMLAYTDIKAPFAGTISQKFIDKGSLAKPGMPLLMVEQGQALEAAAMVPESYIRFVSIGDAVEVEVKSVGRVLRGTISELSTSAAGNGGQYAAKISLEAADDASLLAGMYVAIRLPEKVREGESSSNVLIDRQALVEREQLRGVYVVNENEQASLRWLRLGKSHGDQVEVLGGLRGDERVIWKANGKLFNGRKVSVAQ